jgi:hypothetical protein
MAAHRAGRWRGKRHSFPRCSCWTRSCGANEHANEQARAPTCASGGCVGAHRARCAGARHAPLIAVSCQSAALVRRRNVRNSTTRSHLVRWWDTSLGCAKMARRNIRATTTVDSADRRVGVAGAAPHAMTGRVSLAYAFFPAGLSRAVAALVLAGCAASAPRVTPAAPWSPRTPRSTRLALPPWRRCAVPSTCAWSTPPTGRRLWPGTRRSSSDRSVPAMPVS